MVFAPIGYDRSEDGNHYVYSIREVDGGLDQIVYDTHLARVEVTVNDNGAGQMIPTVRILTPEDEQGIVFRNEQFYDLSISKSVEGNMGNRDRPFRFILRLWTEDELGVETPWSMAASQLAALGLMAESETGHYSFTLRHGDTLTLRLPGELHYALSEEEAEYAVAFRLTDALGNELQSGSGRSLQGQMTQDQTAAFTNTLTASLPTRARTGALSLTLALLGFGGTGVVLLGKRRKKEGEG